MPTRIHFAALLLVASCTTRTPLRRPPGPITQPAAAAAAAPAPAPEPKRKVPPKLEGLGPHQRPISHASNEAQQWFDQGLNLVFGFNHEEAIRSFAYAAERSPDCAMCFWGVAYAHGPHLNNPQLSPESSRAALAALKQAQARAPTASPVEQSLISALATRYEEPPPADRALLDLAYAEAMRAARELHPKDADLAALTAEALMDLHPWDFYGPDGEPKPWTAEILAVIQAALALQPNHPLANHLWIHAIEASNEPARAKDAADVLRTLQPGLGHMVHMPSHIDVRTGEWEQALDANKRAIVADANYRSVAPEPGFYALYMAHNRHMYAWAAMMSGRGAEAQLAIAQMVDAIPASFRTQSPAQVDAYFALPLEVLMRFGKWDEILAFPEPDERLPAARALRHAARGVAFAAKGDVARARDEQQQFEQARARVPADYVMGQNPVSALNEVASHLLAGEILYREKQEEAGLAELRKAVEAEDRLRYDEPPDWIQPTRHALGAALTQSRKYKEAEAVFREDLRRTPRNGWALFGLARALRLQGKTAEAQALEQQFDEVWSKADLQLESACLCQSGR